MSCFASVYDSLTVVQIMCAGVTAYTACKRSSVRPGQWVVVQGAGGGLGQFAVQYAKVMVSLTGKLSESTMT
jgi:D-arabinose 1-dehydrogenase-like Zn-dependent alcohol dehydrogenase